MSEIRKLLQDGRWIEIEPRTFGKARIIVTDGRSVDDSW